MASAKQIAWRKKFGRMAKAGKFTKKDGTIVIKTPHGYLAKSSTKGKQKGDMARVELARLNEKTNLSIAQKKRQKLLRVRLHSSQYDKYYHD